MSLPSYSFEFFPPRSDSAEAAFWREAKILQSLDPAFMTVTYGAGGATRDKTIEIAKKLHQTYPTTPIAAHLTFINATKDFLFKITDELWDIGIRHIVALRGDLPKDLSWPLNPDAEYFQRTSDFVESIKARHNFEISVGAYPEMHPDAGTMAADIEALKKKCDAGASRAITQFFFENDVFYRFVDQCRKAGIETPIVPGILPVHDIAGACKFAARCGASVPRWLRERLEGRPAAEARDIAEDILAAQTLDLARSGAPHIHFYTLNKSDITRQACEALRRG